VVKEAQNPEKKNLGRKKWDTFRAGNRRGITAGGGGWGQVEHNQKSVGTLFEGTLGNCV